MIWLNQLFSCRRLYDDLSEEIRENLDEKIEGGAQRIPRMLYGVRTLDFSVFTFVALISTIVAVYASALAAWRASRLDPRTSERVKISNARGEVSHA
jgi:hypothetical protein